MQRGPVGLREVYFGCPEERRNRRARQRRERSGPRGIDRARQRQRRIRLDLCERETGDFGGRDGHVLRGDGEVFRFAAVHRRERAGIERGQAAASEEIIHLGLHRLDRRRRGVGGVKAQRRERLVALALRGPVGQRLRLGEELVELRLIHSRLAAAIRHGAERADDFFDGLLHRRVRGGLDDDHAVAVELRLGENLHRVRNVRERDDLLVGLVEIGEDALGPGENVRVLDGGELNRLATADEVARILERRFRPLHRGDDFGRTDATILVGVNKVGGLGVELNAARRHGERHPKFLVELVNVGDVRAVAEHDLIHAADADEFP